MKKQGFMGIKCVNLTKVIHIYQILFIKFIQFRLPIQCEAPKTFFKNH